MKNTFKAALLAISLSMVFSALHAAPKAAPLYGDKADSGLNGEEPGGQAVQQPPSTEKLKEILCKLVKQDEYLDETIEDIETKNARLNDDETGAALSSLKLIRKNMEHISYLNKNELAAVNPDPEIYKYTKTIMLYSAKITRKTSQVAAYVNSVIIKNKKTMRNAPASGKSKKKGKKLGQILQEQKNLEQLGKELAALNRSAGKVKATSKWLYIASK